MRAEWVEKRIFYLTNIQSVFKPQSWQNLSKKKVLLSFKYVNLRVKFSGEVKVCQSFQAQRVINWGIKNLKSDCFNPIKTGGLSEIPKLHKALTYWVKRLSTIKNFQKSNIFLEGSRHPKFMNHFEYGESFHKKSFPKRIGTLTPFNPKIFMGAECAPPRL